LRDRVDVPQAIITGNNRSMKKPSCTRVDKERANIGCSRRGSSQRHLVWVAAECTDVALNPFERCFDVEQRIVSRQAILGLLGERGMIQEAE